MKKWILLICALFFLAGGLSAQETTAEIYGTVVLPDGSVIPGVAVTMTADVLGTQTAVTSNGGNFRFLRLLPGNYELKLELDGFKTVIRKGIRLYAGKNVTLTIPMETTTIEEEIVVTAKTNVIEMRRTSVGMNITKEALQSLPSARNPWSVLSMVPGIMTNTADVGGSESGQQSNPNAGGTSSVDTTWKVDGIDNSSLATVGTSTGYLDVNNYEELQVTTGGTDITAQTGGVQINFVSKRGGNRMSGDFHIYVEDGAWEMSQTAPEAPPVSPYVTPGINRLYQYGASIGGPIKKDKLWWFGAWSMQDIHARAMSGDEAAYVLTNGYGKLNAQFGNTSAEFHLSYDRKLNNAYLPKSSYSISQVTQDAWRVQTMPNYYWYGTLQQVLGNNLMLNAKIGIIHQSYDFNPNGSNRDPISGHEVGNEAVRYSKSFIKQSGSANDWFGNISQADAQLEGNLFVEKLLGGDHELRFGVEYNSADSVSNTIAPNQRTLYVKYYGDFTSSYGIWLIPDNKIDIFFKRVSGYISDTATFKRLTLNLGLRYDLQAARINKTDLPGFTWVDNVDPAHNGDKFFADWLGPLTIQEYKVPSFKSFSPRFSLTYDIKGDGKNVIKLSAARYGSRVGTSIAYPLLPTREIDVYWYDNGDGKPTYNELNSSYGFNYAYANYCTDIDYKTGHKNARFADDYNTPLLDELTLSFEKQVAEDLAVSLTGFYKKQHNLKREIGIMADGTVETKANWYKKGTQTVNGKTVDYWDRYAVPEGVYFTNYQKNHNRYMALQLALTKKFSKRWMADASLIFQDWKQFRFAEETFNMTDFDYWNEAPFSPRSIRGASDVYVNSRWQFKLSGLFQLPWNINVTAVMAAQEGYILGNYAQSAKKLKGGSYQYLYESDKKFGDERLPAFWTLNLGLEKKFPIDSDGRTTATVFVDAYNLTNNGTILARGAQFKTPSFGLVTKKLNPGIFQFGLRLNF